MSTIQYARTETKSCPLTEEVCLDRVADLVSQRYPQPFTKDEARDLIIEKCGRYTKGKNAGKVRGWAYIEVVVEGGWKKDGPGYMNGHVVRPGRVLSIHIRDYVGKVYFSA